MESFQRTFGRRAARRLAVRRGDLRSGRSSVCSAAGYRWAASDEDVLVRSLPRSGRRSTARRRFSTARGATGTGPVLLFRDHDLSGPHRVRLRRRGPAGRGAAHFVSRLLQLRERLPTTTARAYVVSVILDGENAWRLPLSTVGAVLRRACTARWLPSPRILNRVTASRGRRTAAPARRSPGRRRDRGSTPQPRDLGRASRKNRAWELLARGPRRRRCSARSAVLGRPGVARDPRRGGERLVLVVRRRSNLTEYGAGVRRAGFRKKLRAALRPRA